MLNISRRTTGALSLVLCSALTACVVAPPQQQVYSSGNGGYQVRPDRNATPYGTEYARVSRIEAPEPQYGQPYGQAQQASGMGAVVGAVIGGVLGNRFGHGGGRAVATGIGVVGGAVLGNALEGGGNGGAHPSNAFSYRVILQMDRGDTQSYYVPTPGDLRPGDRVRVYDGQISRY